MENNTEGHERPSNAQEQLLNVRNRLFNQMFRRLALQYGAHIPYKYRRLIEINLFIKACVVFFILVYFHFTIFSKPIPCLDEYISEWPRDGVLRIEILSHAPFDYSLADSYRKQYRDYKPPASPPLQTSSPLSPLVYENVSHASNPFVANQTFDSLLHPRSENDEVKVVLDEIEAEEDESFGQQLFKELLWDLNDPESDKCLGDNFNKFLLEILGFNDVILSSVKNIVERENYKGYLVNVITGEQYRFVNVWLSRLRYLPAFLFMIIFTLVVSMLLRYSHHQIFIFILGLIQNFEMNARFNFPIAPFITIVLALVGIEEIMTDFFNDTTTAFYIILIVWIADQYDSICCNNPVSKKYWLRFFFLYHYVFYAYHYRFNGHHSHLALFSSWLFILHSMVYFFHHYELPSLENMEAATRLIIDNRVQEINQIRLIYHGHIMDDDLPSESAPDSVVRLSTALTPAVRLEPSNITLCEMPFNLVREPPLTSTPISSTPRTSTPRTSTPRTPNDPCSTSSSTLDEGNSSRVGIGKIISQQRMQSEDVTNE